MNEGERAWTIDEIPLDWCFQPGVKLDFRHFADGYVATAADVEAELERIGHALSRSTSSSSTPAPAAKYGRPDYVASGCGMGRRGDALSARTRRPRDRHRRLELGRAVRPYRQALRRDPRRFHSSGRATRRAVTSAIAISRSCTISKPCPRPVSWCCFPQRSTRLGRLDASGRDNRTGPTPNRRGRRGRAGKVTLGRKFERRPTLILSSGDLGFGAVANKAGLLPEIISIDGRRRAGKSERSAGRREDRSAVYDR